MNEDQTQAVEQEQEVEVNPVETLVNQITDGELAKAETSFSGIIQDKITDALESQRVAVAQAVFNDNPEHLDDGLPEIEDLDVEIEDSEVESDETVDSEES